MNDNNVKTNSLKAWVLASRLYSITGAAVPVAISMALAWTTINGERLCEHNFWTVLVFSFLFAFAMQIDANIINDYFDFIRGNDDEEFRQGPKRACVQGWVTLPAMRKAIAIVTVFSCIAGLPLAFIGGWAMVPIGILCVIGAFLYTTHLSYKGLGDVLCFFFFGIVPTCVPYYIITNEMSWPVFCVGLSAGVVIDAMMLANNYRDIPNDIHAGKRTICVIMGQKLSRFVFAMVAPVALLLNLPLALDGHIWAVILPALTFVPMHFAATRKMYELKEGPELNVVLAFAAKNIMIYGIATVAGILI